MADDMIVCAVSDQGSPAAVVTAADEAARLGAELQLVHVTRSPDERTDHLLEEATALATARQPRLTVSRRTVDRTWIAAGLAEVGRGARYLVVEQTGRGRVHRVLSGSTADGVSFKAPCPVLSIPHGWALVATARPTVVTAAVQDASEVPDVVGLAAEEAENRGAELVVIHATNGAFGHDESGVDSRRDWVDRAHRELDGPVNQVLSAHPDLKFRLDVVLAKATDVLVRASKDSMLLVAGRRHHTYAGSAHLGPVVHQLLLHAACPVLLAPDGAAVELAGASTSEPERAEPDSELTPGDVVVAVGEDDAAGAIRFAVAEAVARAVGLHMVHTVRMPVVDGVDTAEVWRYAVADGRLHLGRAVQEAWAAAPEDLRITRRLLTHGGPVHAVAAESARASVVVVQHRHLSRARRLRTWSVTNGLAGRCDGAVVAVPADWAAGPERIGCVVVGVQDSTEAPHLLAIALEEAVRRGLPLRVVHASQPAADSSVEMTSVIDDACRIHPDVVVHRVIEDRDPVELLVGAVTTAELVVVGRRHHLLPGRSHLGPVARAVLDRSPYPVMLAPHRAEHP